MLFDLRGSGRRRTVKIVYIDARLPDGRRSRPVRDRRRRRRSGGLSTPSPETTAAASTARPASRSRRPRSSRRCSANPQDPAAWARARPRALPARRPGDQLRPATRNQFTAEGKARARQAAPTRGSSTSRSTGEKPDDRVASLDGPGLHRAQQPDKAVAAQEIIAEDRNRPRPYPAGALAYQAGQTRKGDLATDKALELTPKDQREALKGQLEQAKQQALPSSGAAERHSELRRLKRLAASGPCSSTGRAADS